MKTPWTLAELEAMRTRLRGAVESAERENPNARPLPPMTEVEAGGVLFALAEMATTRALTPDEAFLHGQLLSVFRMAVRATTLGHQGRYFVVSADEIEGMGRK